MGPMSPVRAYSHLAGLCPEKLVEKKLLSNTCRVENIPILFVFTWTHLIEGRSALTLG